MTNHTDRDLIHEGTIPEGSALSNGAPAESDRNSLSLSPNGPLLLHDVHLVETLAHFNRANVPERRPHAKGSGAFGEFAVTGDVSAYTKAAVFQPGTKTRMLARFSTVPASRALPTRGAMYGASRCGSTQPGATSIWSVTLNENPKNFFAQIEQAAFAPSNTVPGIGFSPDKMLIGRVFAYADAHRARIGTNFHQLTVN